MASILPRLAFLFDYRSDCRIEINFYCSLYSFPHGFLYKQNSQLFSPALATNLVPAET